MNTRWLPAVAPLAALAFLGVSFVQSPRTLPGHVYQRPNVRPSTSSAAAPVNYARYFFSTDHVNSPATQAARWPLLIGQGNQQAGAKGVQAAAPTAVHTVVYADPLYVRATDPDGVTTTTNNANTLANHPSWILRNSSGAMVQATNFANQDYAADIGNPSYQKASIQFLLAKIKTDGWNGVFLDDTNPTPDFTFSTRPVKYPTDASWQAAELAYVRAVCGAVRNAGYRCYLNLGQQNTQWAQSIATSSTGPMNEFFVAMNPAVGGAPSLATIENGRWLPALTWAKWAEANTQQQIAHASTSDDTATDYALASFLLISQGKGAFAANRSYTNSLDAPYTRAMSNARKLGAATSAYVADASGVYYRTFAHGRVVVNPHSDTRVYRGVSYLPATGTVTLTS